MVSPVCDFYQSISCITEITVYKRLGAALTDGSFFADLYILLIQQKVNDIIMDNAISAQIYDVAADHISKPDVTRIILFCCSQDVFPLISYLSAISLVSFVIVIPVTFIIINLLSVYTKTILFL